MNTTQSLDALAKFTRQLKAPRETENGDVCFDSSVNYKSKSNSVTETLEVKICLTGYSANKVVLSSGKKITAKLMYLEFNPEFQDYTIAKNGSLIIKQSNSQKIGDYEVTIQER